MIPSVNPKIDPIVVARETKSAAQEAKQSLPKTLIQKKNPTAECNALTSQILAKLADAKEKLFTTSKAIGFSPSPGKENLPRNDEEEEKSSSSEEDDYTLNTGRLKQLSLKNRSESEKEISKDVPKSVVTTGTKDKQHEIKDEIMQSSSKIKQYYAKKH